MDLTIRGEGFGSDKSKLAVHIGETPAVVRRVKNGNIIARLPDVEDLRAGVASWRGERGVRWDWLEAEGKLGSQPKWRTRTLGAFDTSNDFSQAAGSLVTGWFVPPISAPYSFFVRAAGMAKLYAAQHALPDAAAADSAVSSIHPPVLTVAGTWEARIHPTSLPRSRIGRTG